VTAARVDRVGEENRVRWLVLLAAAREDTGPEFLHAVHDRDDAAVLPLVRVFAGLALLREIRRRRVLADALVVERAQLAGQASAS
jgi:hypothetical protein